MCFDEDEVATERRFSSLGFDQHYRNMSYITEEDVITPSIGGAGSALLANILIALGFSYVDLLKETIFPSGRSVAPEDPISKRIRPDVRRSTSRGSSVPTRRKRRFMKTHLPAEEFRDTPLGVIWLLIRDPRDALYSWHQYHRSFAETGWEQVPRSFESFLQQEFFLGGSPVDNWVSFNEGWLEAVELTHLCVIRFEDLKRRPFVTMRAALDSVYSDVSDEELKRAIEDSTFDRMRSMEEDAAAEEGSESRTGRVMRAGAVEGWKEWMTPRLSAYFATTRLVCAAARFGYLLE